MSQKLRRFGPVLLALGLLVGLAVLLAPPHRTAAATNFSDPFWTTSAGTLESACGCSCSRPSPFASEYSAHGTSVMVSQLTGELVVDQEVVTLPGKVEDLTVSLRLRSMNDGTTMVPTVMPAV